jgi:hypothetical protein
MSRSAVSASGSPYVLELHDFEDPKFDDARKPVFSVATPAGERFDTARLEQVPPEGEIDWLWPGMIPLRRGGFLHADRVFGERTLELVAAGSRPGRRLSGGGAHPAGGREGPRKKRGIYGNVWGIYGESMGMYGNVWECMGMYGECMGNV